jgi:hypothetical protein
LHKDGNMHCGLQHALKVTTVTRKRNRDCETHNSYIAHPCGCFEFELAQFSYVLLEQPTILSLHCTGWLTLRWSLDAVFVFECDAAFGTVVGS